MEQTQLADSTSRQVAYKVLRFLEMELQKQVTSKHKNRKKSLEFAMKCLETAFGIDVQDETVGGTTEDMDLDQSACKRVAYEVLKFLSEEMKKKGTSTDKKESLKVVIKSVQTAFDISVNDSQYKSCQSFKKTMSTAGASKVIESSSSSTEAELRRQLDPNFEAFAGKKYVKPREATEDEKKAAEKLKAEGNRAFSSEGVADALDLYTRAINLDGNNAVYFSNRAAAYIALRDYKNALRDCQIAIQLRPTFARPYGRMGEIYLDRKDWAEAAACFVRAKTLEPDNATYKENWEKSFGMFMITPQTSDRASPFIKKLLETGNGPTLKRLEEKFLENDATYQKLLREVQRIDKLDVYAMNTMIATVNRMAEDPDIKAERGKEN